MNRSTPRHRAHDAPPVAPAPHRYPTIETDGRTDLCCGLCGQRIAFGIKPERLADDGPFYAQAHAPFCRSGHL